MGILYIRLKVVYTLYIVPTGLAGLAGFLSIDIMSLTGQSITELKTQRLQLEMQIRSIIETHSRLLEMGKEEDGNSENEANSKVQLLQRA